MRMFTDNKIILLIIYTLFKVLFYLYYNFLSVYHYRNSLKLDHWNYSIDVQKVHILNKTDISKILPLENRLGVRLKIWMD